MFPDIDVIFIQFLYDDLDKNTDKVIKMLINYQTKNNIFDNKIGHLNINISNPKKNLNKNNFFIKKK